jgi:hypothetical protein
MPDITDVFYPFACLAAWRGGDEYACVELVRALCSPNLLVRIIAREVMKDCDLKTLLTPPYAETLSGGWDASRS